MPTGAKPITQPHNLKGLHEAITQPLFYIIQSLLSPLDINVYFIFFFLSQLPTKKETEAKKEERLAYYHIINYASKALQNLISGKFDFMGSNPTKSLAFSLIEIMVGLIVTSVMVAAFAPVITKKVSFGGVALSTTKSSTTLDKIFVYDPSKNGRDGCSLSGNVLSCPFKVPNGVYAINAILVSPGGGGGASSATSQGTFNTNYPSSTSFQIEPGTSRIDITNLISGGGGGGGGAQLKYSVTSTVQTSPETTTTSWEAVTPSADVCAHFDASYLDGYCITNHNAGDSPDFNRSNFSTIDWVPTGSTCSSTKKSSNMCCWFASTKNTAKDCTANSGYSACTRTVCMGEAGKTLCGGYDYSNSTSYQATGWRIPSNAEAKTWGPIASKSYINLCDHYKSSSNNDKCKAISNCGGESCSPQIILSSDTGKVKRYKLYNGSMKLSDSGLNYSSIISVRCMTNTVKYKKTTTTPATYSTTTTYYYKIATGGGGASGARLTNISIPESIIKNNIGNDLVIEVGYGGGWGGPGYSTSESYRAAAESGYRGGPSSVYIKIHGTSTIVWGVRALGGYGGGGGRAYASYQTAGSEGSSSYTIQYYNTSTRNWETLNNISQIGTTYNVENPRYGSTGVTSAISSSTYIPPLSANDITFYGGAGGSIGSYGKGGNGGKAMYSYDYGCSAGVSGTSGFVSLSIQKLQKGAAGGGGGGGSMVRIENITVTPGKTVTVKVGKAGSGGVSNGANGTNGNPTSITYNGITYSIPGGSGGKGGTTAVGAGGSASIVPSSLKSNDHTSYYRDGSNGQAGAILPAYQGDGSSGGLGGFSGITNFLHSEYSIGYNSFVNGCGGLSKNASYNCFRESSPDAAFSNSASFSPPNRPYEQDSKDYGSAGTGGGGGGIKFNIPGYTFGKGSNGLDGYIYLWWQSLN